MIKVFRPNISIEPVFGFGIFIVEEENYVKHRYWTQINMAILIGMIMITINIYSTLKIYKRKG